jgi:cytochrome P450
MTLYPEVQKRAQTEIDQFVGKERLPTISDQRFLVYTAAIMKEVLRWAPVGPLGFTSLRLDAQRD